MNVRTIRTSCLSFALDNFPLAYASHVMNFPDTFVLPAYIVSAMRREYFLYNHSSRKSCTGCNKSKREANFPKTSLNFLKSTNLPDIQPQWQNSFTRIRVYSLSIRSLFFLPVNYCSRFIFKSFRKVQAATLI